METKNDEKWMAKYNELSEYIAIHGHLPNKKKEESRGLLNWWKYNKKRIKQGLLNGEKLRLMQELSDRRRPSSKPQEQIRPLACKSDAD